MLNNEQLISVWSSPLVQCVALECIYCTPVRPALKTQWFISPRTFLWHSPMQPLNTSGVLMDLFAPHLWETESPILQMGNWNIWRLRQKASTDWCYLIFCVFNFICCSLCPKPTFHLLQLDTLETETQKFQGNYSENGKSTIRGQLWKTNFKWLTCHHVRSIPVQFLSMLFNCFGYETISFDAANPHLNLSHTFYLMQ